MVSVILFPMSAARRANSPRGFLDFSVELPSCEGEEASRRWCAADGPDRASRLLTAEVRVWNSEVRSWSDIAMVGE